MKLSLSAKCILISGAFIFSSCATTKYTSNTKENDFSNLRAGKTYTFKLKHSTVSKKMIFSNITKDSVIGYSASDDKTRIAIAKENIMESKDINKASMQTAAVTIGALGAAAIIISSSRSTK